MRVFVELWRCEGCGSLTGGIARTIGDDAPSGRPDWRGHSLPFRVESGFALFEGQDERIPIGVMRRAWAEVQKHGLSVKWERYRHGLKIRTVTIVGGKFGIQYHK